jgi:hypothetical protein
MPVSTPNGYLDFTNATPRATKVIATSNVGVGTSNPEFNLDVHGTANVGTLTATTATVSGDVYAPNLPLATIGSNLVTWNDSTGVFQDSGGLFSNKLAVVSEQPPSALAGASTTITNHGVYKVTASTGSPENAFDKSAGTSWTASSDYGGGGGTGVYVPGTARLHTSTVQGDWIALEFPYKTTLRHLTFTGNTEKANLYATNDGGITWTELKNWESGETTVVVDASENYKKYGLVTTKTTGSATLSLTELRFFTESFAIDGGKVAMASGAITGGNTVVDQTGPHARHVVPLRKYPGIVFTEGEFEGNDSTNTYTQGGYTVSVSSVYDQNYEAWEAFNNIWHNNGNTNGSDTWLSENATNYNGTDGLYSKSPPRNLGTGALDGEWIKIEMPHKIKLDYITIYPRYQHSQRSPRDFIVYGSNDNVNWSTVLTETGASITSDHDETGHTFNVDVNDTYYKYFGLVTRKLRTSTAFVAIAELKLYGYEETSDPDTSVDTKITSQFNLPDTTGVKLYIDGDKGSTATDFSGEGHTLTENNATYDSTEKAWEFSSLSTSNVVSDDLGFEGDHPHSVSLWFNAANVSSNATLFHVGTAAGEGDAKTAISLTETGHLGWIDGGDNQFLSANTWHNLVYATQGGGGLRTCYLDGRKLGDVSVQDTFGDYPPFAMTGYSQGGYTVSANHTRSGYYPYNAFNNLTDDDDATNSRWWSSADVFSSNEYAGSTSDHCGSFQGAYLKLELPYRLICSHVNLWLRDYNNGTTPNPQSPKDFKIVGSNDDINWVELKAETNFVDTGNVAHPVIVNATKGYKYLAIVVTKVNSSTLVSLMDVQYYGHKENDTTRFPVSSTVLKYPHIAMTGPAQRGYVVTSSSSHITHITEYAFDGKSSTFAHTGESDSFGGSGYAYDGTNSLGGISGFWVKLNCPNKIKVSRVNLRARSGNENQAPADFTFIGSNDDTNWTTIQAFTGQTPQDDGSSYYNITSDPNAYKYLAIVITKTVGDSTNGSFAGLVYYGTEEEDVIARVGEGLDGKVANFRVYDKYLHEEQALELWDAQKDQFGRAESSVVVHKGRLGVGTTEPEGRFAVLDEPGDMEEFPPRAMTDYETYMEGHGVFRVSASSEYNSTSLVAINAFNKIITSGTGPWLSSGSPDTFVTSTGLASSEDSFEGTNGPWIKLELPYNAKPERVQLHMRNTNESTSARKPKSGIVYGYKGGMYHKITDFDFGSTDKDILMEEINLNTQDYYSEFVLQITSMYLTGQSTDAVAIKGINYFGTRERGQSTLHDGQLTLTKNLTVPRIGPALDADDTPRRDRLVVEYNTSTNPTANGTVKDTSGRGLDGLMVGVTYDSTEKALVFDGTDDYVESGKTILARGTPQHSFSFWVRPSSGDHDDSNSHYLMVWGSETSQNKWSGVALTNDGALAHVYHSSGKFTTGKVLSSPEVWYHVAVVVNSTSATTAANRDVDFYINGESYTGTYNTFGSNNTSSAYYLDWGSGTYTSVRLGSLHQGTEDSSSSLSNLKLYDTALTADEVKRLYDMGRCDEGHHVVNFSKTRVGIGLGDGEAPTYTLDVRGQIRSQGTLQTSFTGQHKCVPENGEPVEKGLIVSATKNKYVKLNGSLDTGKKAITIDESLPVVSLSNVAQDKACFGVVSSTEEANTVYRIETTNGGVISHIPKTLGDNRVIVNSVGEGAIWVCDANGPLESGDYITTSNVAGYGQKQTGEFLANYTVAKITMDCDFTGSNVAVQAIKKAETLQTVTEDAWEGLGDYDRSSNTETQYINESNVVLSVEEYESLAPEEQNTYSETTIQTYYRIQRGENVLDEHGMLQWENTGATEPGYELRYLDATGQQTDEANCVHRAAFVGCTYHCG